MGMLLSEESAYFGKYGKATNSTWNWIVKKLKGTCDLLITSSPILWILFFLMLTVLASLVGG